MKRRLLVAAILLVITVCTAVGLFRAWRVPSYQGKNVYDWMFEQKTSGLESSPGFMAIGSNAVPFLARALAVERTFYDRYAWVRSRPFQIFAARCHLGFTWRKDGASVRHSAAWSLLAFSFEAAPALPQLHAELLRAKDTERQTLVHCLSEMGPLPQSIPWLVKAFPLTTNETYVVRHDLLHTLGNGGTNAARQAMPLVLASLQDPEWQVRSVAAYTLARWAQPAPTAVPDLLGLLNSTNESAAVSAASALGQITNRCDEASPGLRRLLESSNDYPRATAAMALWRLGGDPEETRRLLEGLLGSKRAKGVAARSLGQMGDIARPSVPGLLQAARQMIGAWVDMYDRAQCAKAVLLIQGESPEAYAVLEESISTEKNSWVRGTMAGEIARLGALARPLVPALRRALNDPNRDVRHEAALALEHLGAR